MPGEPSEAAGGRRGRISDLMLRLFHPEDHKQERVLLDLLDDLQNCHSIEDLCKSFGAGLLGALDPTVLHLFVRRSERLRLSWSSQHPLSPPTLLPDGFRMPEMGRKWSEPQSLGGLRDLSVDERQWLRSWGAEWVVPICSHKAGRRLVGLLLVGRREGNLTAVQRDLLMSLCDRMATCYSERVEALKLKLRTEQGQGNWLKECPACHRCFGREVFFCTEDDTELEPTILIDRLVDGRYLLEQKLGRGGMGAVYRAVDQTTRNTVAVKILTGGDHISLGRFANETRVGQEIDHPSVTQVLGSGSLGRQGAYMAMEYVQGRTLRAILDQEAPIEPRRLAGWAEQILSGVHCAHQKGIIHRDLKPDNMMVSGEVGQERIKLLDFGLAKLRDTGSQPALTAAGMVIGTLSYMSPEQLAAETVDHRTDIFALGAILSEALTGRLPFFAPNLGKMLQAVATQPYSIEVHTVAQARVGDVLGKALAKAPAHRYDDVEDFRAELVPALEACESFSPSES